MFGPPCQSLPAVSEGVVDRRPSTAQDSEAGTSPVSDAGWSADRADISWEVHLACLDAHGESIAEATEPFKVHQASSSAAPAVELWVSAVLCAAPVCADAMRVMCKTRHSARADGLP